MKIEEYYVDDIVAPMQYPVYCCKMCEHYKQSRSRHAKIQHCELFDLDVHMLQCCGKFKPDFNVIDNLLKKFPNNNGKTIRKLYKDEK